ncbi:MAG: murein biosynthesis integral membrane protein MurJ [Elusimicrobiota bacterium]
MNQTKHILRNVGKITTGTLMSRILGYARDMAIANFFGANWVADSFYVAYRIPNLLRRLLGEGSLTAAFIPIYTEYLEHKTREERDKFLGTVITFFTIILIIVTILGIVFTPLIVKTIAPGFTSYPERMRLAVTLTRLMFPFFIAIGLSAIFMGILHAHQIFMVPAAAPCFLSISELFFLFVVCPFLAVPIKGLAVGVVCGGAMQCLFQLPSIIKSKIKIAPYFESANKGFRRVLMLMAPSTIAVSVDQINAFVDVICASWLAEGSVTALYYANHLMLFPLALFGIAVASVSLPSLSKSAAYKNIEEMKATIQSSMRIMMYLLVPSSIGLMILAKPIVSVLFERGRFDARASEMTAFALVFYAIGISAYAGVKILATAFYALKDTKTPVKIAVFAMILNVELNIILINYLNVGGLALATAISSAFNVIFLMSALRQKIGKLGLKRIFWTALKVILAGFIMGGVCYFSAYAVFAGHKLLQVLVSIVFGTVVYGIITYFLKVEEAHIFYNAIKNRIRK